MNLELYTSSWTLCTEMLQRSCRLQRQALHLTFLNDVLESLLYVRPGTSVLAMFTILGLVQCFCMSPGLCLHHMQIHGLCKLVHESVHELDNRMMHRPSATEQEA